MKPNYFTVELRLIPQNEGQDLNYHEFINGTFIQIERRLKDMINGLESTLPKGTFTVKLENIDCTETWYFDKYHWYNSDFQEITKEEMYLLPVSY